MNEDPEFERQLAEALEQMTTRVAPDRARETVVPRVEAAIRRRHYRFGWVSGIAAVGVAAAIVLMSVYGRIDVKGRAAPSGVSARQVGPATVRSVAGGSDGAPWRSLPRVRSIADFKLMTPEQGWIRTDIDLRHTADGGQTWQVRSLPADASLIDEVTFVDDRHIAAELRDTDGVRIAMTTDGAATWRTSRDVIPLAKGGQSVTLTFVSSDHGWLFLGPVYPSSIGAAYETTDGGTTWHGPAAVDTHEGRYSPRNYHGGGIGGQTLVWRNGKPDNAAFDDSFGVSPTGGSTWINGSLPTPDGVPHGLLKMDDGSYVTASGRILMLLTFDTGRSGRTGVFSTDDGRDWKGLSPLWGDGNDNLEGYFASDTDWLVISDHGTRSYVTSNAGADWQTIEGTSTGTQFDAMTFATTSVGWAMKRCDGFGPNASGGDCQLPSGTNLYVTHDSGKSWTLLLADAAGPDRNPSSAPTATFETPEGVFAKGAIWHLRFNYPAAWNLKATDFDADSMYGSSLRGLGSVGTVPITETCDWPTPSPGYRGKINQVCSTTWDPEAPVQIRFERDGRDGAWDMWSGVMKPTPPGYEPTSIGGLPALMATANSETVPDSDEIVPGAQRIMVWAGASRTGWSFRITAVLRGPDTQRGEQQVRSLISSMQFDPEVKPLATDPASAQAALSVGLDAVRAQAARSNGAMSAACFPDEAGVTNPATIAAPAFLGYRLTKPVAVRCTSSIEPTAFQVWKMTLRYEWDGNSDHPEGAASLVLLLSDDGGFAGDVVGDTLPGLVPEPGTP